MLKIIMFFLLPIGLGCVGSEYKYLRKIMGENLGGSSAWRYGAPEKAAPVEADNAPMEIPAEETSPAVAEEADMGADE